MNSPDFRGKTTFFCKKKLEKSIFPKMTKFQGNRLKGYKKIAVSVPSGNFGNITAGILAKHMGLPIKQFIGATNINKAFGDYLGTGEIVNRRAIPTISNAMDISIPNNLLRLKYVFGENEEIKQCVKSFSINDSE